ncbi:hypothetical protein [Calothrix sp. FACHB-1219]|nr:hypothetical protein [Calothrix sp. FACHB-1219]
MIVVSYFTIARSWAIFLYVDAGISLVVSQLITYVKTLNKAI